MVFNASASLTSHPRTIAFRAWLPALIALGVACGVFGIAFQQEISGAVKVWTESTAYNHCFLVLPLIAVLLWMRRGAILTARLTPTPGALLFLPVISAIWVLAAVSGVAEAQQLLVVLLFEIFLLAVLGWRVFRSLLAPLLFLFFLVPFGAFLVPALQIFTADFAARGLRLVGVPVFADGLVIQIPEGSFEVVEACAGLRFLIASIVFGCFFATVVYTGKLRRLIFILLATTIPVVANGVRAFGLILLAHLEGSAAAVEADHVIYGWLFFTLINLLLIMIGLTFARHPKELAVARSSIKLIPNARPGLRFGVIAIASLGLIGVGPIGVIALEHTAAAAPLRAVTLGPAAGYPWRITSSSATDWQPTAESADATSITTFQAGERTVTEFVATYRIPMRGSPLTRAANGIANPQVWHIVETGRTTVRLGDNTATVNIATLQRERLFRSVWWFYMVDGHVTASPLEAKLLQLRAAFLPGEHLGKFIAVSSVADSSTANDAPLTNFLGSLALSTDQQATAQNR